jgi:hypothetical protein
VLVLFVEEQPINNIDKIKDLKIFITFFLNITANVPALGEVANFGTDYFLLMIKFLARNKREFTTKFAILPNACFQ